MMSVLLSPFKSCKLQSSLWAEFHTSYALSNAKKRKKGASGKRERPRPKLGDSSYEQRQPSSRRRLVGSIEPSSSSGGAFEVAPCDTPISPSTRRSTSIQAATRPGIVRDAVPHRDPALVVERERRSPSYRRMSESRNERDWERRKGRWEQRDGFGLKNRDAGKEIEEGEGGGKSWNCPARSFQRRVAKEKESEFFHPPQLVSVVAAANTTPSLTTPAAPSYSSKVANTTPTTSTSTSPVLSSPPTSPIVPTASTTNFALPTRFTSPPLMPGLLKSIHDLLGPSAKPTPIQALSMKWLMSADAEGKDGEQEGEGEGEGGRKGYKEYLLASETGSGKSIAYLLPVLQSLKLSEMTASSPSSSSATSSPTPSSNSPASSTSKHLTPRALILSPTHELSRQLSTFAKKLLHEIKLRVLCASQANVASTQREGENSSAGGRGRDVKSARVMAAQFRDSEDGGEFEVSAAGAGRKMHPVDVVVGTPMKVMEMVRGRGWDRIEGHQRARRDRDEQAEEKEEREEEEKEDGEKARKLRRGRDKMPIVGRWRAKPEMGLENIEWVVVDEADVLFDPDFRETTLTLLSDIAAARGFPITAPPTSAENASTTEPIAYPFNLLLTSATIPSSLNTYLSNHHPTMTRLASPRLHHLPKTLRTEHVPWTGGNKFVDVEKRVRTVWKEEAEANAHDDASASASDGDGRTKGKGFSKVLIFCNKSAKVNELGEFLDQRGIKNVALTSTSQERRRGSNKHLEGFLRPLPSQISPFEVPSSTVTTDPLEHPHVLITTSLLSRGLDFDPSIKHVFIVDEPRNMVDFLHRAGRSGRAGEIGKVVVFGKMEGRGSERGREVRRKVGALRG